MLDTVLKDKSRFVQLMDVIDRRDLLKRLNKEFLQNAKTEYAAGFNAGIERAILTVECSISQRDNSAPLVTWDEVKEYLQRQLMKDMRGEE